MMSECQIVIVDDDREDQLILLEYFKESGTDNAIRFFSNGQRAIEYLTGLGETCALPKLIILDLNMPVMNGTETLLHIKRESRFCSIPVIIYSTSENETEKRKCLSLGAVEYLVKPSTNLDAQMMIRKFNAYLR